MNEAAHTTQDGTRQVVVRQIGDVTVTLDMPRDMPTPKVELLVHRHMGDVSDRLHAIEGFGMTDEEHLQEPDGVGMYWYTREEHGVEATVWFNRRV